MVDVADIINTIKTNSVLTIIFYIILVIGQWRVFEKAGEEGWKSIIPIYNTYILWKIAGKNFIITVAISIAYFVVAIVLSGILVASNSAAVGVLSFLILIAFLIYVLVVNCSFCDNLSKAFGHGGAFALGLLLLRPIFLIILGFNSDEYQGVQEK